VSECVESLVVESFCRCCCCTCQTARHY